MNKWNGLRESKNLNKLFMNLKSKLRKEYKKIKKP